MVKTIRTLLSVLLLSAFVPTVVSAADYYFTIKNKTKSKIVKLLAVEKGKSNWGEFDIGDGIAAGETEKIEWGAHTNNSGCNWYVKAKFADGSSSPAQVFDFCQNPDLEYSE